jgi:hypothetical protein
MQRTVPTLAINKTLTHLHICATKATNIQLTQHPSLQNHQLYIQMAGRILHFLPGIKKKLSKHCNNVSLTDSCTVRNVSLTDSCTVRNVSLTDTLT